MNINDLPLQDIEISKVMAWPDPVFFVRQCGDILPLRCSVQHRLSCLVFDSEELGNEMIEQSGSDLELLPASNESCKEILTTLKSGGVSLVWINPTNSPSNAVLHQLEDVLAFLNRATEPK